MSITLSSRQKLLTSIGVGLLALGLVMVVNPDARYRASRLLGIPISPINRTDDSTLVSFRYEGRKNVPIEIRVPRSYLWSIVDQHAQGESQLTGIDVVGSPKNDSGIALMPYSQQTKAMFEAHPDKTIGIIIDSYPVWLPAVSGASETTRLNDEALTQVAHLSQKDIRSDGRVSEILDLASVVEPLPNTDAKWYRVIDFRSDTWIAKCTIHYQVVVAPQWRCAAQYISARGLAVRMRFPLRFIPLAPELRDSVDRLLVEFEHPVVE